jgi:hypothetical protein
MGNIIKENRSTQRRKRRGFDRVKIDCRASNTRCSTIRMSLKNKARPERFELPTLWFEASQGQNPNGLFGVAYELRTPSIPRNDT